MIILRELVWDNFNVDHIARHDVRKEEVEEVLASDYVSQQAKKGRVAMTGLTIAGRILTIMLAPVDPVRGLYYPVTARPASRSERAHYRARTSGDT